MTTTMTTDWSAMSYDQQRALLGLPAIATDDRSRRQFDAAAERIDHVFEVAEAKVTEFLDRIEQELMRR